MKRFFIPFIAIIVVVACQSNPKDYATLSGKITHVNNEDKITILNRFGYKKVIPINEDGTFKDTLKVEEGKYFFTSSGNEYVPVFLKNDTEISIAFDTENFYETLEFTGDVANKNNFYVLNILLWQKYLTQDLMSKTETEFDNIFASFKIEYAELKKAHKDLDSTFFKDIDSEFENVLKEYKSYHKSKTTLLEALPAGSPSPTFEDFENYRGGTTSLSDLKGKFVYIDVWATWCAPCIREIPALKALDAMYHGKNIDFVSLSIDDNNSHGNSWEKAKEDWKTMIADKALSGIHLLAPNGWQTEFVRAYKIDGIPRFILIDPDGNIVNADAPRPSDPSITDLFSALDI